MIALITGINGQDGSFLAELLLSKNYEVHGLIRRSSTNNLERLNEIIDNPNLILHYGDLTDGLSMVSLIKKIKPNEIYNFGAQSDVKVSFDEPLYTSDVDGLGTLRLLEAIHLLNFDHKCKFYQSSTSELFGNTNSLMQNEKTPFNPDSPYAAAKLFAYNICEIYKKAYGIFICNGILFNHESERRGEEFVTQKIIKAAFKIKHQKQDILYLGNLYSKRDWGYAKDYVAMIYQMMHQKKCDNYVIATSKEYTVKYFCEQVFKKLGINIIWQGEGLDEVGIDSNNQKIIIKIDKRYYRPIDVNHLKGDPTKAIKTLKYNPNSTDINQLIDIMLEAENAKNK